MSTVSLSESSVWLHKTPRVSLLKQDGVCTCHVPQLPIHRASNEHEWMHLNTGMWATTYHIHEDGDASDCDGHTSHSRVLKMTDYARHVGITSEYDLWKIAVDHAIFAHGHQVTVKITNPVYQYQSSNLYGAQTCDVSESTDEGYRATTLRSCTDPGCADDRPTYRDYRAEQMGY